MHWTNHINADPEILAGKPIIKGTRIGVDLILEKLSLRESVADLLAAYPMLNEEKIYACLAYAAALIRNKESYPCST